MLEPIKTTLSSWYIMCHDIIFLLLLFELAFDFSVMYMNNPLQQMPVHYICIRKITAEGGVFWDLQCDFDSGFDSDIMLKC